MIDAEILVDFDELRRRPDLDRLDFVRGLRLDAVSCHHSLETHRFGDQHDLDHQVGGGALREKTERNDLEMWAKRMQYADK